MVGQRRFDHVQQRLVLDESFLDVVLRTAVKERMMKNQAGEEEEEAEKSSTTTTRNRTCLSDS